MLNHLESACVTRAAAKYTCSLHACAESTLNQLAFKKGVARYTHALFLFAQFSALIIRELHPAAAVVRDEEETRSAEQEILSAAAKTAEWEEKICEVSVLTQKLSENKT